MGESTPQASKLIRQVTGHEPILECRDDGSFLLRIGQIQMVAEMGLWSDPGAWQQADGSLVVTWANQSVLIPAANTRS